MSLVFTRVPSYDRHTGDKRVWTNTRRNEYVVFVIDLETMRGLGIKAPTMAEARVAADHFAQHFEFPNGAKP